MIERRNRFIGKTTKNAQTQKEKSAFGYLRLPSTIPIFKEDPGSRVRFDIIPYVVKDEAHPDRNDEFEIAIPGTQWYRRPFKTHRNIGADNSAVICPKSIGKKCPICEYREKLLKEGANWQDDGVKALRASDRNLYLIVPLGHNKYDEKPHVWDISQHLFQTKLNDELEEQPDNAGFPDLEDGLTLKVRFSEEVFGQNKFADTSRIDFEERDKQYGASYIDKMPCLDEVLDVKDYVTLERMFMQGDEDAGKDGGRKGASSEPRERNTTRERTSPPREEHPPLDDEIPGSTEKAATTRTTARDERATGAVESSSRTERSTARTRTPDPDPEPNPPAATTRTRRASSERAPDPECPAGHKYGIEADDHEECADCKLWDACMAAREKYESGK